MNYSVFMRVVQHLGGQLMRKRSGSCEERGLDALGPYTWTFGSRGFKEESERQWKEFEAQLLSVRDVARKVDASFSIFVSPLVFDVDPAGRHPHFNHTNLDFSCATIEPRARLAAVSARLGIPLLDPANYLRGRFDARVQEGNFTPFFFTADENHFTATTAGYIADFLSRQLFSGVPTNPPRSHDEASRLK